MTLSQEAIQHLQETSHQKARVEMTPIPLDADNRHIARYPDGTHEIITPKRPPIRRQCTSLANFLRLAEVHMWEGMAMSYERGFARCYPQYPDLRDEIAFEAGVTCEAAWLDQLHSCDVAGEARSGICYGVSELYQLLDGTLHDAFGTETYRADTLKSVQHLKTIRESSQQAERTRGSFTGGVAESAVVSDVDKLPNTLTLHIAPYLDPEVWKRIPVQIRMEPDPEIGKWWLHVPEEQFMRWERSAIKLIEQPVFEMCDSCDTDQLVYSGEIEENHIHPTRF
jgi:hypothetical protein